VAGGKDGGVWAFSFDGSTASQMWSGSMSDKVTEIAGIDVDDDGKEEAVIGDDNGKVAIFTEISECASCPSNWTLTTFPDRLSTSPNKDERFFRRHERTNNLFIHTFYSRLPFYARYFLTEFFGRAFNQGMEITAITKFKHGGLFKALRKLGWSQNELARRTGLSPNWIGQIINLHTRPSRQQADAIQKAFGDAGEYLEAPVLAHGIAPGDGLVVGAVGFHRRAQRPGRMEIGVRSPAGSRPDGVQSPALCLPSRQYGWCL